MPDYDTLKIAMKSGKVPEVKRLVDLLLTEGAPAKDILNLGLLDAMNEVGQRFKRTKCSYLKSWSLLAP